MLITTETIKAKPDVELSNVQKLVRLAMKADSVYIDNLRAELTKARKHAYNDEIGLQARRSGCQQTGELTTGPALTQLNEVSKEDAKAYARSYNDDLAKAIVKIGIDTPSANRNVYAARLRTWEGRRAESKAGPLAGWVESSARSLGFEHFIKNNGLEGTAHLEPTDAVCPVCAGIIARGEISLKLATGMMPPFHYNCPHFFVSSPAKIDDCAEIWAG